MSLSQFSYALSFMIFQGIFRFINGTIVGGMVYNNDIIFPNDPDPNDPG